MNNRHIAVFVALLALIALYVAMTPRTAHGMLFFKTPAPALTKSTFVQTYNVLPAVTPQTPEVIPKSPVVTPMKPVVAPKAPDVATTTPKFTFVLFRSAQGIWSIVIR